MLEMFIPTKFTMVTITVRKNIKILSTIHADLQSVQKQQLQKKYGSPSDLIVFYIQCQNYTIWNTVKQFKNWSCSCFVYRWCHGWFGFTSFDAVCHLLVVERDAAYWSWVHLAYKVVVPRTTTISAGFPCKPHTVGHFHFEDDCVNMETRFFQTENTKAYNTVS